MEERKLNILIVHNYYKLPGGEGVVVENEKNMLKKHGHNVFLYTRDNKEIDNYSLFQKILLPFSYLFSIKTYKNIKRIISEKHIDIVHVHNTINIISKSVYYACFNTKTPVVQTIHNFRFLCPNGLFFRNRNICEDCVEGNLTCAIKHNCYRDSKLETLLSVINMKQMRRSKIFSKLNYICLTDFGKEKLLLLNDKMKNKIDESSIYIKPNFCFDINKKDVNSNRDNYYVYASRLEENKGIKFLLNAWKSIDNSKLIVCGSGELDNWCKSFIIENKVDNVEFVGNLEHDKLLDVISKSKGLIYPTRLYESFGLSIIEAYSVGTPVLVADFGNAGSLVKTGVTGFKYVYDNNESFLDAFKKINNSNLFKNAYDEYINNYSEELNYKRLTNIYNDVINKRNNDV